MAGIIALQPQRDKFLQPIGTQPQIVYHPISTLHLLFTYTTHMLGTLWISWDFVSHAMGVHQDHHILERSVPYIDRGHRYSHTPNS